ncbi:MAG: tRNA 2-thiouridine(34) synthase MnmA [Candidatus Pacebacteria bacterium]|jgi:tRNA-specific 2-thiouridylase|nr:tRNA 2-thiouridine(34) synthase MnmA [Candidatus Paceibacterota bacterium]
MDASNKNLKVVCAMSGGVDSSVAAVLLKKAGFEVIGVFMKFWASEARKDLVLPNSEGLSPSADVFLTENRCCSLDSEQRARKTALQLGIPFYVLDLRHEFKAAVVDRFVADTKSGLTPNPCVVCNKEIKFGLLIEKAAQMGADFIATGHYAQIKKDRGGAYHLSKGADKGKEQSYFLWRLSQKQLARIIFPVGGFEKTEVRALAKKWRLPSAATAESQEVCFANGDLGGFLEASCGTKPGKIVDESGNVLGQHQGLWFYTIGQRKGIKLSGGPYYVIAKNRRSNKLVVSLDPKASLTKTLHLESISWVGAKPVLPLEIRAKIRYRAKESAAVLRRRGGKFELEFSKPQFAATPGQSAVFYRCKELLGGGIIAN